MKSVGVSSFVVAVLVTTVHVGSALAWGPRGHEQVADIAWTQLTPTTKQRLKAILSAGDSNFKPTDDSEAALRKAFRRAANFPDVIKGNRNTIFESIIDVENSNFPIAPGTDGNEKVRCKTWHYYDTPLRFSPPAPSLNGSNAQVALDRAREKLRTLSQTSQEEKMQAWYLCWIEHISGDVHQPLHCAESFEFGSGDAGGNAFKLGLRKNGKPVNLHSYWDSGIDRAVEVGGAGLSSDVESVTKRWTEDTNLVPPSSQVENQDVSAWIAKGASLADTKVYTGIKPTKIPTQTYINKQVVLCKKQAMLAGYRLAKTLNDILGT